MDIGERRVSRRLVSALALLGAQAQARPIHPMQEHRLAGIGGIEATGRVGHEHHRELQALGAVDGHHGHTAGAGAAGHGILPRGACQRRSVNGPHQRRDAAGAGPGTEGSKPPGILPAAGTVFHHAQCGKVAGGSKDLLQQLFCRGTAGHPSQLGQPGIERPDFSGKRGVLPAVHGEQQRAVEADALGGVFPLLLLDLFGSGPQADKVVIGETEQRAQHGGGKIDILRRVVNDLQQGDEGPDVGGIQQVFAGIRIHRDAPGGQRFHIGRKIIARRQQDAAVLVLHRAGGTAVPHRLAALHHLLDAPGDPARVRFGGVIGQEMRLHAARVFPGCPADQPLAVAVGRVAEFRGHEPLEQEIDPFHHLRSRAEVGIQRQHGIGAGGSLCRAGPRCAAGQGGPAVQFFPEDAGVCLPEAVDALLQISHQKEVVPCRGCKAPVQGILQGVGVLIFIHHHGGVVLPDDPAQRSGGAVRVTEQTEGLMLKVAELQQLPVPLFGREPGIEIPHRREQRPQAGFCGPAVCLSLLLTAGDQLKDLRKQGRALIGAGADDFFVFAVQPLFHPFQAGQLLHAQHIGGQQIVKRSPLPRHGQLFHPAQQRGSLVQPFLCIGIFFQHGIFCLFPGRGRFLFLGIGQLLLPVARAVGQRGAEQLPCRPGTAGSFGQQQIMPTGGGKAIFLLPRSQKFVQLFVVIGQGAQEIVDMQDRLPRRTVGAALAVEVGKGAEIRVAVGVFQRLAQGRGPQELHTAGVCGGKIRRDIQRLKVLAQQVQTEGIDGADGRALQQHPLAAQRAIAGFRLAALQKRLPDAGPQLCRRRIGKGDDEQTVRIHGMLRVGDEPDSPLGQNSRFAAARRRAHQQRAAPVLDGGPLGGGPLGFTHACSSSPSSGCPGASKGFAGASSARSPMPVSWQQTKP